MIRWLRELYPRRLLCLYFLAPFAVIAMALGFVLLFGLTFDMAAVLKGATMFCKRAYGAIPLPLCFIYGLTRVMPNHPILNPKLGQLLMAAPWSQGNRLPFGPWYLVPQDLVLLIWWTLFFCYGDSNHGMFEQKWWYPFLPIALCVLGYIVAAICSLFYMGQLRIAFMAILIIEILIPYCSSPLIAALGLLILYGLVLFGLNRSIADSGRLLVFRAEWKKMMHMVQQQMRFVGWPFYNLSPRSPLLKTSAETRIWLSMIFGWLLYLIASWRPDLEFSTGASFVVPMFIGGGRLLHYLTWIPGGMGMAVPPFTIAAQIRSGRFFTWAYHRVLVAPVLAPVVSAAVLASLIHLQFPHPAACSISVGSALLVALFVGPSAEAWRLNGHYRISKFGRYSASGIASQIISPNQPQGR